MNPERVLAGIESFASARVVEPLAGGPVSDSYLVERAGERFVLRIDHDVAAALGLDRQAEAGILAHVASAGLGPAPVFSNPEKGILIMRYLDGRAWTAGDLDDAGQIRKLAALLRTVHALEPYGRPLDLSGVIDRYARLIATPAADETAADARRLLRELDDPSAPHCLCHGDPNGANVIEGQGLLLIDWEYAGVGDPLFDLATLAEHHGFDEHRSALLLDAYDGTESATSRERFARFRTLYRSVLELWTAAVEGLRGNEPQ